MAANQITRREFSAAALASVLAPDLDRRGIELFPKEGMWSHYVGFCDWWDREIADPTDQSEHSEGNVLLVNLDSGTKMALYFAFMAWMDRQRPEPDRSYKPGECPF